MSADATIQRAIAELEAERKAIDNRIAALRAALTPSRRPRGARGNASTGTKTKARRRMSAAARKGVSARMKKYWAERRKTKTSK